MNIKESLIEDRSKKNILRIVDYILEENSKSRTMELMQLVFSTENKLSFRASWAMIHLSEKNIELINPFIDKMVKHLYEPFITDSVKRNILRTLESAEIPEDSQGYLVDICFKILASHDEPIAPRVFAMTVLYNLCKNIPELKEELRLTIEEILPYASSGLKNRGQKILKKLSR